MRFSGLLAMGDFWRIVREFNPEGIEREVTASLDMVLVGAPGSGARTLAASLAGISPGQPLPRSIRILDLDTRQDVSPAVESADAIILVARLDQGLPELGQRFTRLLGRTSTPLILVFTHADLTDGTRDLRNTAFRAFSFASHLRTVFVDARESREVQVEVIPRLLESVPRLRDTLARQLPAARAAVAEQIIAETCRVNAQFALAANLPANIPFVGGVAGDVADFFVLTKNQVMMVLRLAAIHGRDVSPTMRVMAEIAPVIGTGFLWRTAARMAAGMLPTLVGAAPKMAVAYVGTYVAGHAARYYYDEGRKPPRQVLKSIAAEGARRYRAMLALRDEGKERTGGKEGKERTEGKDGKEGIDRIGGRE